MDGSSVRFSLSFARVSLEMVSFERDSFAVALEMDSFNVVFEMDSFDVAFGKDSFIVALVRVPFHVSFVSVRLEDETTPVRFVWLAELAGLDMMDVFEVFPPHVPLPMSAYQSLPD